MASINQVAPDAIEMVAHALEEITDECVFIGGAALQLYVQHPGAAPPRPTMDVDIAIQLATYAAIAPLNERLANKGIYPSSDAQMLYRYTVNGVYLDIVPTGTTPLGPTNSWLQPGLELRQSASIGTTHVFVMPVSYFLASKWEAFKNRGSDFRWSPDFEDIIYILSECPSVLHSIENSSPEVQTFLGKMAASVMEHPRRMEVLECHLDHEFLAVKREAIETLLQRIRS